MPDDAPLLAALAAIRERGAIGESSLRDAVAHADRFVALVPHDASTLIDLGSGGGLPGLVIGWRLPQLEVVLVERRTTRADLLRRAVRALDCSGHVRVVADDVAVVAQDSPASFDVVTARSFARPEVTAHWVARLLAPEGTALISEPPEVVPDRWPAPLLATLRLVDGGVEQGIRVLRRAGLFHVEHS